MSRVENLYLLIVSLVLIVGFPLVLFSAPVLGESIGCSPPGSGNWILNGSNTTVCDNVNLTINGNVSIYYNSSLIINNSNISTTADIELYENASFNLLNSNLTTISETTLNDNSTLYIFNSTMDAVNIYAYNTSKINYIQSIITIDDIEANDKTNIIINNSNIYSDVFICNNATAVLISSNISILGIEPTANSQTNLTGIIQNSLITGDIKPSYSDFLVNISNTNITLFQFGADANTTNIIRDSVLDYIEVIGNEFPSNNTIINVSFQYFDTYGNSTNTITNSIYTGTIYLNDNSYIEFNNLTYSEEPTEFIISGNTTLNFLGASSIYQLNELSFNPTMYGFVSITNKSISTFYPNTTLTRYYPTYIYNTSNEPENTKRILIIDSNLNVYFNTTTDAVGYINLNFTWNSTNYNNTYYITDETYNYFGNLTITKDTPINLTPSCAYPFGGNWIINESQNINCVNKTIILNGNLIAYGNANFTLNNSIISATSNSYSMMFYGNSKITLADVNSSIKANFSGNTIVKLKNTIINNNVDITENASLKFENNNTINTFGIVGVSGVISNIYIEGNLTISADSPISFDTTTTNVTRLFNFYIYNSSLTPLQNINMSIWDSSTMLWNGTTNSEGYVQSNFTFITSMLSQKYNIFKNGTWQDYLYLAHDTPINIIGAPPEISNHSPTNQTQFSLSTTNVPVEINTTTNSLCRYSTTADFYFSDGTNFTSTGSTTHRHNFTVSSGNAYNYYYKCLNSNGITRYQFYHRFSVESAPSGNTPTGSRSSTTSGSYPKIPANTGTASVNILYDSLRANQKINIKPESEKIAFTVFNARVTENIEGISNIIIKSLEGKPTEIALAPSSADIGSITGAVLVYQYIQLDHLNLADSKITDITIEYKVPKTWISNNSADENKVYLMRFADSKWNKLTTIIVLSGASYVNYKSASPGLSIFAVVAEVTVSGNESTQQGQNQNTTNSSNTNTQTNNNPAITDSAVTNTQKTPETKVQESITQESNTTQENKPYIMPLIIIITLLFLGSGFFYFYKKKTENKYEKGYKIGKEKIKYDSSILGILDKEAKEKTETTIIHDETIETIDIRTVACKELILYYEQGISIENSMAGIISEGYPELDAKNAYTDVKSIINYIKMELGKGFSNDSIRQKLISTGWTKLDEEIKVLIIHIKSNINNIVNMDTPISPSIPHNPTYESICKEVLVYIQNKENIPTIVNTLTNKNYPTDLINIALMDIEKIGEYMQTQLGRGYKPDVIKQKLIMSGWQMEEAIIDTIEKILSNR